MDGEASPRPILGPDSDGEACAATFQRRIWAGEASPPNVSVTRALAGGLSDGLRAARGRA